MQLFVLLVSIIFFFFCPDEAVHLAAGGMVRVNLPGITQLLELRSKGHVL